MHKSLFLVFSATLTLSSGACGSSSPQPDAAPDPIDASAFDASPATAFCNSYETTCGFSNDGTRYTDPGDCLAQYQGFCEPRQTCVEDHLGYAVTMGVDPHCLHATGIDACTAALCP